MVVGNFTQIQVVDQSDRSESIQHWPSRGGRQRRFGCCRGAQLVASFGRSSLSETIASEAGITFSSRHHAIGLVFSVSAAYAEA